MSVNEELNNIEKDLDILEAKLDVLEPIVEAASVVRSHKFRTIGALVVVGAAGVALGYFVAKQRMTAKYDAIVENEIHEAKEYYAALNKVEEYETPEKAVEKLHAKEEPKQKKSKAQKAAEVALTNYQGVERKVSDIELTPTEPGESVEEVVLSNIFVDGQPLNGDDYDEDTEAVLKSQGKPYVITEEEFGDNEDNYEEHQVTWYAKDEILADDQDEEIKDADDYVGEINMTKFGQGSNDKHIVFIRNDARQVIIEVARSTGSYAEEVAGFRHSDDSRNTIRRFRGDDE